MAAITAGVSRQGRGIRKTRRALMANSTTIPKGALVTVNASGLAINAADTAGTAVIGVAAETKTSGTGGNDWIAVEYDFEARFAASSITQAMVGLVAMCVVDNNTVDDAAGPTNDIPIGLLTEFISTTEGWVHIRGLAAG